ncbi:MAG: hypothetical protein F9K24_09445 [Leptonema illini]|uniref:Uncharacterized protein n=1 Tax=Leptonema illini TaxID=183 RepID=A0A833M1P2_9LEPT|nr:MAG: hypothetical protein F9K24_09445 [Leptonema illini]
MIIDRKIIGVFRFGALIASIWSSSVSAGPAFDEPPQPLEYYRRDILRYSDREIVAWEEFEKTNGLPVGSAPHRLLLKFLINPTLMERPEGLKIREKGINLLTTYIDSIESDEARLTKYPGLLIQQQAYRAFLQRDFLKAIQLHTEVEEIERSLYDKLVLKNKGRPFNKEAAYAVVVDAMLVTEMFRALYLRLQSDGHSTKGFTTFKRIDCAKWECLPGHFQYWLALHIIYDDPDGFKKAIREDMKGGRSRSHTFLSKEVNALYFEYFRDHEYWLTDSFKRVLDEMEKENDRVLPSCKAVSLFGRCIK